ncbi:hypothetical protein D3C84_713460 [compost metagenome]
MGSLHAKGCREPKAKRALMARGNQCARFINWEAEDRSEPDLGNFLNEKAIAWQHVADNSQVAELTLHSLDSILRSSLGFGNFRIPMLRRTNSQNCFGERLGCLASIGDQVNLRIDSANLCRVNINSDQLQPSRTVPPANVQQLESRTDNYSHVSLRPQPGAGSNCESQRMFVAHNATTAPEANHRRTQNLGQLIDLGAGVQSSRTYEDHWRFCLA